MQDIAADSRVEHVGLPTETGTYEVHDGDNVKIVEDVSFSYGPDHELVALRDGQTVAVFRWWSAIIQRT